MNQKLDKKRFFSIDKKPVVAEKAFTGGQGHIYKVEKKNSKGNTILIKEYHLFNKKKFNSQEDELKNEILKRIAKNKVFYLTFANDLEELRNNPVFCFPRMAVFNDKEEFIGFAMVKKSGDTLNNFTLHRYRKYFSKVNRLHLTNFLISYLKNIQMLHKHNIFISDYSLRNILLDVGNFFPAQNDNDAYPNFYILDCDSFQINVGKDVKSLEQFSFSEIKNKHFLNSSKHIKQAVEESSIQSSKDVNYKILDKIYPTLSNEEILNNVLFFNNKNALMLFRNYIEIESKLIQIEELVGKDGIDYYINSAIIAPTKEIQNKIKFLSSISTFLNEEYLSQLDFDISPILNFIRSSEYVSFKKLILSTVRSKEFEDFYIENKNDGDSNDNIPNIEMYIELANRKKETEEVLNYLKNGDLIKLSDKLNFSLNDWFNTFKSETFVDFNSFYNEKIFSLLETENNTYLCDVGTLLFTHPELFEVDFKTKPRELKHELFSVAIVLFMLLMLGQHPFNKINGNSPLDNMKEFSSPYLPQGVSKEIPKGDWGKIWSNISPRLRELFYITFNQSLEENKEKAKNLALEDWIEAMEEYKQFIINKKYKVNLLENPNRFSFCYKLFGWILR